MLTRYSVGAIVGVWFMTGTVFAETDSKVDFGRDVLPLIRQNCMTCHGPNVQMNNFRLDRRSTAMRGGTRSVIVPGSSASSRLRGGLLCPGRPGLGSFLPRTGFSQWI